MDIAQEYRMYKYQDYGVLGTKEHITLLRNKEDGQICVKKVLDYTQKDVFLFRLKNDNVYFPKVYEVLEREKDVVIIEEYIAGVTLEEYMAGQALPEQRAVSIAVQIGRALFALHLAKPMIVYRDLKPENIMITKEGNVKLVDFNISRTFHQGQKRDTILLGTAEYAAPEQFGYSQTDNRTDIYAFGVVFNYMLTGHSPIDGIYEGRYGELIKKCIEMDPSRRYQTIEAILTELSGCEEARTIAKDDMSWKIPGFRSNVLWKKVFAVLGYAFMIYMSMTMEFVEDGVAVAPAMQWVNRSLFAIAQIMTVLVCSNYRNMADGITLFKSRSRLVRILSYVATWFVFAVIAVVMSTFVGDILHL